MKANKELIEEAIENVQDELDEESTPIKILSKNRLKVKHSDWSGVSEDVVTRDDVNNFALNWGSGIATLGNIVGDWREIQEIADSCFDVFKRIDEEIENNKK